MRSFLRLVMLAARVVKVVADLTAVALVVLLLTRAALFLSALKAWNSSALAGHVKGLLDAPLHMVAGFVGVEWPGAPAVAIGLPIIVVVVVLVVRAFIAAGTRRTAVLARRRLDAPRDRRRGSTSPHAGADDDMKATVRAAARKAAAPAPTAAPAGPEGGSPATEVEPIVLDDDVDATIDPTMARAREGVVAGRIGRYEILEELGRGAMGVVYKAYDPQIGRTVAIKSILSSNLPEDALESFKERFAREARAAGQLSHPRIVSVYDLLEDSAGQPCMVMEFVEGPTLHSLVRKSPIGLERALEITLQAARALDYAHDKGVVHRDIKPANILVDGDGRIKITDFGIAKMPGTRLTQTGQIMGTPAYMSPEQFLGGEVDARSDLFSLGAVLYWMCTGEVPFPGETITAVAAKVLQTSPVPARELNPDLPEEVGEILGRCLAKDPEQRYADCGELAAGLEAYRIAAAASARESASGHS